jgi:hypothetical protein
MPPRGRASGTGKPRPQIFLKKLSPISLTVAVALREALRGDALVALTPTERALMADWLERLADQDVTAAPDLYPAQ